MISNWYLIGRSRLRTSFARRTEELIRENLRVVKRLHRELSVSQLLVLRQLTKSFRLSLLRSEMLLLDGTWYVTHSGLLRIAERRRCSGIQTELVETVSEPSAGRWVFKVTVRNSRSQSFVAYGDAYPSNVSTRVHGAEIRVA